MSRELISSEKFPPKPHNSKYLSKYVETVGFKAQEYSSIKLTTINTGPATKIPGLVFCAGQTATGEIKQATVSNTFHSKTPSQFGVQCCVLFCKAT